MSQLAVLVSGVETWPFDKEANGDIIYGLEHPLWPKFNILSLGTLSVFGVIYVTTNFIKPKKWLTLDKF